MEEKIRELLKINQIDFKIGLGDYYDYLIYSMYDKIIVNCKTYYDKDLKPYYSLQIKVIFENCDKYEYNSFSCNKECCILFFERIMLYLGVFPEYD